MEPALTLQDKENALSYTGTWYDAIKSKDVMLLRALIGVRGNQQLKRQVSWEGRRRRTTICGYNSVTTLDLTHSTIARKEGVVDVEGMAAEWRASRPIYYCT